MAGYLGILKWSLAQTSEEANNNDPSHPPPRPMSPERAEFLKQALAAATVDPIEEMKKLLANRDLENLKDFIDNIDYARDFLKIGGMKEIFSIIISYNNNNNNNKSQDKNTTTELMDALEIFGLCVQNHPENQQTILKLQNPSAFDLILPLCSNKEEEVSVRNKAFFALSCFLRENDDALKIFLSKKHSGLDLLLSAIDEQTLKTNKLLFLLSYIFDRVPATMSLTLDRSIPLLCRVYHIPSIGEDAYHPLLNIANDYSARQRMTPDMYKMIFDLSNEDLTKALKTTPQNSTLLLLS